MKMMLLAAILVCCGCVHLVQPPFALAPNVFDSAQPATLGLQPVPGAYTSTVFTARAGSNTYNHGAVLLPFKGELYVQWQSSARDEDADDTEVRFSKTSNHLSWSEPKTLAKSTASELVTNGGWWTDGETLVAYLNIWPKHLDPKAGYVSYITSTDGRHWSHPKRVKMQGGGYVNGVIEQDLKALPSGRVLTAVHTQPGLIAKPYFTDDPLAISGWREGHMTNLPHKPGISRELEPSWFLNAQGEAVMTFRDQGGSYKVLASVSRDNGESWSLPMETNMPDSRAKQSAGNLPDGRAYIVNNPSGVKARFPLVLSVSNDGKWFDEAWLLRAGDEDMPAVAFEGRYKRVGYSYPKSIVWNNAVYVAYAESKENIVVTRVPIDELVNSTMPDARKP
ncbi:exo-alpha-sialidase [Saccharophagus degradans]|uniref:sialidase family protein n=1 Tax=Saccharophagus degradans TaxID=86304 RepID=UPI001C0954CB|nr:sialidase family protein [Saccharophagus degradans]MBU2985200.1 exo-alpha-sialidase [Saccharophagus degradans]